MGEIHVIRVPRYTWPVAVYLKFSEDNISQRTMYCKVAVTKITFVGGMKLLPLPPLPFQAYQVHVCQSLTPFVVLTGWAWRQRSPRSAPNALQCYFLHDKINGLTQLRLIRFVFHLLKKDVITVVLRCSQVYNETRMFAVLCGFPLSCKSFFFSTYVL